MALQLRPTCEHCNQPLPPDSLDAMICTFECTFCRGCVENVIFNVCPNCGGGFCPRPIRPKTAWKDNLCVASRPPTTQVTHAPVDAVAHEKFAAQVRRVPPEKR